MDTRTATDGIHYTVLFKVSFLQKNHDYVLTHLSGINFDINDVNLQLSVNFTLFIINNHCKNFIRRIISFC